VTDVAHTLVDWWNQMADLHDKYGQATDIETKPEWAVMQRTQEQLLLELRESTGTPEDILFENMQRALLSVLGHEETTLSQIDATQVVAETVRLSVHEELAMARASGLLN